MPKKINPQVKERAVRLVHEHRAEYSSTTAAAAAVARQLGVGAESVRRWVVQSEVDGGIRAGVTSEEHAEINRLRARVRRLEQDNEILKAATTFLREGTRPPQPLIMGFIDTMRVQGHAVESVTCRSMG